MTKTETLHKIARLVADENVRVQLETTADTLELYRNIEDKTDEDLERLESGERGFKALTSNEYLTAVENTIAEAYSKLSEQHLTRLLEEIEFEQAMGEVGATLTPALMKLQQDFVYGAFKKPTLQ